LSKSPPSTPPAASACPSASSSGCWPASYSGWPPENATVTATTACPAASPPGSSVWAASAVPLWPRLPLSLPGIGGPASGITRPEQAAPILEPLLLNAYRAFDQRGESAIYDVLARSVHGELLRRLYLETLQALSLEGREGARVTIQEFSADVDKVTPADAGFTADCQWTALGTVGHWGHTHTRVNRYTARVTVSPVEGAWKITALEVLETVRL